MKNSIVALLFLSSTCSFAQTFLIGSDISLKQPVGAMTRTMNNAVAFTLNFQYKFKSPFAMGMDFSAGTYGSQTTRQQYTFDNGDVTETNVVVTNNLYTITFNGKYFLRNSKKINPYVSGKVGMSWFATDLRIEDPDDQYNCHPLESDKLLKDHTLFAGIGGGAQIDFSSIFKKMESERFYIDVSVHSLQGGTIHYMNAEMTPGNTTPDNDVMARFINTATQIVHEHHVGYVYSSIFNMMDYRIGVICKPGWQH
jgi:hypothetical protein